MFLRSLLDKEVDPAMLAAYFRVKYKLEEERIAYLLKEKQQAAEAKAVSVSDSIAASAEAKTETRKVTIDQDTDAQSLAKNGRWKNLITHTLLVNLNNARNQFTLEEVFTFQEPFIVECDKFASESSDLPDNLLSIIILLLQKMKLNPDVSKLEKMLHCYIDAGKAAGDTNFLGIGKVLYVLNAVATAIKHIQDKKTALFDEKALTSGDEKELKRALADKALADKALPIVARLFEEDKQFEDKQREEKSRMVEQHQQWEFGGNVFEATKTEREIITDKNNRLFKLYIEFDEVMRSESVNVLLKFNEKCSSHLQTLESVLQRDAKKVYDRYFAGKFARSYEELLHKILSDLSSLGADADKAAEGFFSEQAREILNHYCKVLHLCRPVFDSKKTAEERIELIKALLAEECGALILQKDLRVSREDKLSQDNQKFAASLREIFEKPTSAKLTRQISLVKGFSFLSRSPLASAGDSSVQPRSGSGAEAREPLSMLRLLNVFKRAEAVSPAEAGSSCGYESHLHLLDL